MSMVRQAQDWEKVIRGLGPEAAPGGELGMAGLAGPPMRDARPRIGRGRAAHGGGDRRE
eukprot:CAMPEP_0179010814 /NCGR_PEP_ID=MMETSP0796-20121207/327_1 /TAXON_ID=73915 /ORGANISM="Pyrodinium bahamense, Strain pbaha01" /LENGTH=58 /DNA_ID=CAMNT_0020706143 /DNA_START=53 /DNA_END=226 /DNA_ORIENTATION=+